MPTNVAAITLNGPDAGGAKITTVYSKRTPFYAVYGTNDRVLVQYADDPAIEKTQRTALAKLNPIRGDINGLIDGWRKSRGAGLKSKAARYDRSIADALVVALEDDVDSAQTLMQATKADIIDERTSWARFEYLIVASATCTLSIGVICLIASPKFQEKIFTFPDPAAYFLWLAAASGMVGAFFSIAVAMRSRTILTDLRSRDNSADAILRIVIGAIAAALLTGLLQTNLVTLHIGTASIGVTASSWILVMIEAFIAGFSERLVPDLLAKSALVAGSGTAATGPVAGAVPGGTASGTSTPAPSATKPAAVAVDSEADTDACSLLGGVKTEEATSDLELPAASGGIA